MAACADTDIASVGSPDPVDGNNGGGDNGGGDNGGGAATVDLTGGSCPANTTSVTLSGDTSDFVVCEISGTLEGETTLEGGKSYRLNGAVFVGQDAGADGTGAPESVLNIAAGARLFGTAALTSWSSTAVRASKRWAQSTTQSS